MAIISLRALIAEACAVLFLGGYTLCVRTEEKEWRVLFFLFLFSSHESCRVAGFIVVLSDRVRSCLVASCPIGFFDCAAASRTIFLYFRRHGSDRLGACSWGFRVDSRPAGRVGPERRGSFGLERKEEVESTSRSRFLP